LIISGADYQKSLQHAPNDDYNPAKAHEYYMRTRELKGRDKSSKDPPSKTSGKTSGGGKGSTKKQAQAEEAERGRLQADANRKTAEAAAEQHKKEVAVITYLASVYQKKIQQKFNEMFARIAGEKELSGKTLAEKQAASLKRINEEAAAKIEAIPKIPENASKAERARLQEERQKALDLIRGDVKKQTADVNSEYANNKTKAAKDLNDKTQFFKALSASEMNNAKDTARKSIERAKSKYNDLRSLAQAEQRKQAEKKDESTRTAPSRR
jgi:hypothetical protein